MIHRQLAAAASGPVKTTNRIKARRSEPGPSCQPLQQELDRFKKRPIITERVRQRRQNLLANSELTDDCYFNHQYRIEAESLLKT